MSCNPLALMWAGWKVTNTLQVIPEWLKAGFSLRCRHTVINSKARWADVGSWSSTLEKEPKGGLPQRWRASRNVCESNVFLRSSLWIGCAKDGESFPKVSCSPSPFLSPTSRKLNLELRWFSRVFKVENRSLWNVNLKYQIKQYLHHYIHFQSQIKTWLQIPMAHLTYFLNVLIKVKCIYFM